MKNNRPTLAQYFVEQSCPDNKFLEEMNNVIPWWEIEAWFKGHLKKERKRQVVHRIKKFIKFIVNLFSFVFCSSQFPFNPYLHKLEISFFE